MMTTPFELTRREFIAGCTAAFAVGRSEPGFAAAHVGPWSPVAFGKMSMGGDLARRTAHNRRRVHHPSYCVPKVFSSVTQLEWPGDWIGRAFLADTLLARSTSQEPQQARQILQALPAQLNAAGFIGPVLNRNRLDEQQLGGNGWLIRALSEYDAWQQDPLARELLGPMLRHLALPMRDLWETYPITSAERRKSSAERIVGSQWQAGRWALTTDAGWFFVLLDGLSRAWQIERSAELKAVIDAGIDRFLKMDQIDMHAQTHSTLSTLRALLRMYALTGEADLLKAVEERYALYRREAMSEHYANINWFGPPRSGFEDFTEPCAVIDSFIVATELWRFTGKAEYLEEAHLIWFNGVMRGQRATGGFGCDSAAGRQTPFVEMKHVYEFYWCCTTRGAEGHSYAIQSAYHTCAGELAVTFYCDSTADLDLGAGRVVLQQTTQYPYDGAVRFKVISSSVTAPITLRLFAPSWMSQPRLRLNHQALQHRADAGFIVAQLQPRAGDSITLDSTLRTWVRPTRNVHSLPHHHAFHVGPLLLGYKGEKVLALKSTSELEPEGAGQCRVKGRDVVLGRINDANDQPLPQPDPLDASVQAQRPPEESWITWHNKPGQDTHRRQVLFKDATSEGSSACSRCR